MPTTVRPRRSMLAAVAVAATVTAGAVVPVVAPRADATTTQTIVYDADVNGDGAYGLYRATVTDGVLGDRVAVIADTSNGTVDVMRPVLSPAGNQIAALVDATGSGLYALQVMNLDGGNRHTLVTESATSTATTLVDGLSWRPDGSSLVFAEDTVDATTQHLLGAKLYQAHANGAPGVSTDDAWNGLTDPSVGTDGSIAAVQPPLGSATTGALVVVASTGTTTLVSGSTAPLSSPTWSPDGSRVYYVVDDSASDGSTDVSELDSVASDGNTAPTTAVGQSATWYLDHPAFSSDGSLWFERYDDTGVDNHDASHPYAPGDLFSATCDANGACSTPTDQSSTSSVDEESPTFAAPDVTRPAAPTITGIRLAGTMSTLTWRASPDVDVSHYVVTRTDLSASNAAVSASVGTVGSMLIKGMTLGHTYSFVVAAKDGAGNVGAASAPRRAVALALPRVTVANTTSSATTGLPFSVVWGTGEPSSARYNVQWSVKVGPSWTYQAARPVLTNTAAVWMSFGRGNVPTVVTRGQTYYVRVEAHDGYGNSTGYTGLAQASVPLDQTSASYWTGWRKVTSSYRWLGSYASTSRNGAKTSIVVTSSGIRIIGDRCSYCGRFRVYVSGVYRATVSSYASSTKTRQVLYSAGLGRIAKRTVTIVPVLSWGRVLHLDGFAAPR